MMLLGKLAIVVVAGALAIGVAVAGVRESSDRDPIQPIQLTPPVAPQDEDGDGTAVAVDEELPEPDVATRPPKTSSARALPTAARSRPAASVEDEDDRSGPAASADDEDDGRAPASTPSARRDDDSSAGAGAAPAAGAAGGGGSDDDRDNGGGDDNGGGGGGGDDDDGGGDDSDD